MTRRNLRAVPADQNTQVGEPKKKTPLSVEEAAASGSHRDLLVAMRERIAKTVADPNCPPRDLASLSRRLQDIAKEIDVLDLRAKQEARESGDAGEDETWNEEVI
ncbi:terminase small subunit [Mycobacterium phage MooMoo]|uniref:Terminase small subunit n=1 Tax=Mycobacterium phage MooMoo TaxID=2108127 RepID=A0A2P1JR42_9CAUD|nr:terminase small subunit [Mycobacterium phage MooMoo]AVO21607.1 hypothetical protein SEA_MOOMOO_1 [Mycobacterium phage MooMoo]